MVQPLRVRVPGLLSELARHGAWLACAKLERLIAEPPTKDGPIAITEALGAAIADVERLVAEWKPNPAECEVETSQSGN